MEDIVGKGFTGKLLENSPYGFCVLQLELNSSGAPEGLKIIYANNTFMELEGGQGEKLPASGSGGMYLPAGKAAIEKYYKSAYMGEVCELRRFSAESDCFLSIISYPLSEGICGCIVRDISSKVEHEAREQRYIEMLHALSKDYGILYILDMETGEIGDIHAEQQGELDNARVFENMGFVKGMEYYVQNCVFEADQDMLLRGTSLDVVRQHLKDKDFYKINYRKISGGRTKYFQIRFDRLGKDGEIVKAGVGFKSVDEEARHEIEQKAAIEEALLKAQKASKAKSDFLSNMSHDIRTPMNAITGFANIAAGHIDNKEKVQDCLNKIMVSSGHLLAIINDVLDMSHIESGRITLHEQEANLSELMHNFMNMIQPQIEDKNQELYIDTMDVKHEEVYVDIQRLERVLINITGNAVKYTDAGGTISIRLREIHPDKQGYGRYIFSIKDTGMGMSEDFLPHVFDVFERERNSTISKIEGTGLGLPIAKSIIEIMGGSIAVKSKQGRGSEFIITLPLKLQEEFPKKVSDKKLNGLRAMIVDDDYNVCDSVSKMLLDIGMEPEWTLSGKEAVLKAQQAKENGRSYYIYIVDWKVPDMDGVEIIKRLRRIAGGQAPIYVLTAYDYSDIEAEARKAGVTAFWQKPLFMSSLRAVLLQNRSEACMQEQGHKSRQEDLFKGKRILLVEDNELNREIATEILEDAGFVTEEAEDGSIAVEKLRSSPPGSFDLVLMDIQMPVMNGYEAAAAIRGFENAELSQIPILAMTANAFEEDRQRALNSGMDGHIAKPIELGRFFEMLEEVFT